MSRMSKAAMIAAILIAAGPVTAAERMTTTNQSAFACSSWAAWREYGLASLSPRGARASKLCPIRLPSGAKVVVIDEEAGEGASEIRYRGKTWFVDNQRLD
jgi:hypothetical protein